MTTQIISLTQLVPSPANVRKTKTGIDGLAASIAVHGLLQNLTVRPAKGGSFEVVAGGRRHAALKLLAKQKKIAGDFPVPCEVRDGSNATEISLAENEMREAMHPADQFEAFKKLAAEGKGPEEIAARFGTTPKIVTQRLKLAVVSPKLIALYRKEEMTLDCLMAFTVCDDHRQQEKVWTERPKWGLDPEGIRDALTAKHVAADSKLAQFVGLKAYEKAGGAVLRDLFDDENAGWLTDAALLNKLVAAKLENSAETVRFEGWKWVEIIPDLDWESTKDFGKAQPVRLPPTAEQQKEIEKLTAEGNANLDEHGEDPEDDDVRDRYYEIGRRIEELSEGEATWPEETKASAGAVIGIDPNGTLKVLRGLIRPEDKAAARKAGKEKQAADIGKNDGAASSDLSAALIEDLTAQRTAVLQALLADNPKVALVAVVHALALDCLYTTSFRSCVKVKASMTYLAASAEGIDDGAAYKQFCATTHAVTKGMPEQPEKLWAWLADKDQKALLSILAVCAACTVDAVEKRRGAMDHAPDAAHAEELAKALKLDMARYWQPTSASYFGRVSAIFVLFAATFITDKLGGVFAGYSFDSDHAETKRIFVGSHDIVSFPTRTEGLQYATYLAGSSIHCKNTVLRYGLRSTSSFGSPAGAAYADLLEEKRHSLTVNDRAWTEIISTHLDDDDAVMKLVKDLSGSTRHLVHYIDDTKLPMVQMFIFDFADRGKEVIFGWDFPGMEHGAAFATRNPRLIEYFEQYFMHCYRLGSPTRPARVAPPNDGAVIEGQATPASPPAE